MVPEYITTNMYHTMIWEFLVGYSEVVKWWHHGAASKHGCTCCQLTWSAWMGPFCIIPTYGHSTAIILISHSYADTVIVRMQHRYSSTYMLHHHHGKWRMPTAVGSRPAYWWLGGKPMSFSFSMTPNVWYPSISPQTCIIPWSENFWSVILR